MGSNNSSSTASVPPNVTSPSEGGGGLTGIIQSAINQVFRGSNWSATSQPQTVIIMALTALPLHPRMTKLRPQEDQGSTQTLSTLTSTSGTSGEDERRV